MTTNSSLIRLNSEFASTKASRHEQNHGLVNRLLEKYKPSKNSMVININKKNSKEQRVA